MGIAVNRVALGYNYAKGSDIYQRIAGACPVGTGLLDGSSLICKAAGLAWFVAPRSTEILTTRAEGGETASVACAVLVTGFSDWFVPTIGQLGNPGYICRNNWVTCTPGVGITTNYCTTCNYASCTIVVYTVFKGPTFTRYNVQEFGTGVVGCFDVGDTTNLARYRTFRCVTY